MELKEIESMTNNHGKKFLGWLAGCNILGVERTETNICRKEFTLVYEGKSGVMTAVLSDRGTENDGNCFYGNLEHFAMNFAAEKSGIRLKLRNSGNIMWPAWYTSQEDFNRWKVFYDEIMQKYS